MPMYYEAIFQPSNKKKYDTKVKKLAGKTIAVNDGWIIKEGPFKGQQCFYIPSSTVGWIPMCDLKDLKPASFARWQVIHKSLGLD